MKTEKEKMLSGELYNVLDIELTQERINTRSQLKELNDSREYEVEKRSKILTNLIPNKGKNLFIQPPFYCDYGSNIIVDNDVYFNFNCVVLDVMPCYNWSQNINWT